jgi:hypothetical protein
MIRNWCEVKVKVKKFQEAYVLSERLTPHILKLSIKIDVSDQLHAPTFLPPGK